MMKIEYDPEADALYIHLRRAKPADNFDVEEGVTVDVDAKRQIVGVEILDASLHFAAAGFPNARKRSRVKASRRRATRKPRQRR
jgi:uncharacterized protein YuzE